jgi:hypothetical protein
MSANDLIDSDSSDSDSSDSDSSDSDSSDSDSSDSDSSDSDSSSINTNIITQAVLKYAENNIDTLIDGHILGQKRKRKSRKRANVWASTWGHYLLDPSLSKRAVMKFRI